MAAAFLCGAIPTGVLLGRWKGVDVRAGGSGNVGATNVARTVGAGVGALTLMADAAKGALPVWAGAAAGASASGLALVGLAAVLGHVFSPFTGFRGGKGVATTAGAFLVLAPASLAFSALLFVFAAALSRRISAASLFAAVALPLSILARSEDGSLFVVATLVAAIIFSAHRQNIERLLAGTEPPFTTRRP